MDAVSIVYLYAGVSEAVDMTVAQVIASFTDAEGKNARPGIDMMQRLTRKGSTAISESIGRLEESGVLHLTHKSTGTGDANVYAIPLIAEHMTTTRRPSPRTPQSRYRRNRKDCTQSEADDRELAIPRHIAEKMTREEYTKAILSGKDYWKQSKEA
jgi:hypothetical protein